MAEYGISFNKKKTFPWLNDVSGTSDNTGQREAAMNFLGWVPGEGEWLSNDALSQIGNTISGLNIGGSGGGGGDGFGWNMPTAMMFGQGLSGIGNLARGWAAIKGLDVAKDSLNFKKDAFNENMQKQTSLLNNQIRDRNIFKQKTMTPGGYQLDKELTYNRIG